MPIICQTAFILLTIIMADSFASLVNCKMMGLALDTMALKNLEWCYFFIKFASIQSGMGKMLK